LRAGSVLHALAIRRVRPIRRLAIRLPRLHGGRRDSGVVIRRADRNRTTQRPEHQRQATETGGDLPSHRHYHYSLFIVCRAPCAAITQFGFAQTGYCTNLLSGAIVHRAQYAVAN